MSGINFSDNDKSNWPDESADGCLFFIGDVCFADSQLCQTKVNDPINNKTYRPWSNG